MARFQVVPPDQPKANWMDLIGILGSSWMGGAEKARKSQFESQLMQLIGQGGGPGDLRTMQQGQEPQGLLAKLLAPFDPSGPYRGTSQLEQALMGSQMPKPSEMQALQGQDTIRLWNKRTGEITDTGIPSRTTSIFGAGFGGIDPKTGKIIWGDTEPTKKPALEGAKEPEPGRADIPQTRARDVATAASAWLQPEGMVPDTERPKEKPPKKKRAAGPTLIGSAFGGKTIARRPKRKADKVARMPKTARPEESLLRVFNEIQRRDPELAAKIMQAKAQGWTPEQILAFDELQPYWNKR